MSFMTIVGGVYHEVSMWPPSDDVYGSAGRAACSIAHLGGKVRLLGYADELARETMAGHADQFGFEWIPVSIEQGVLFHYVHGLATPHVREAIGVSGPLKVSGECILRYGMWEGNAVVDADRAVYDPQNTYKPERFGANGSQAKQLAIVLNEHEAATLLGSGRPSSAEETARAVAELENAEVVVIKRGPRGALVFENGHTATVPSYETQHVSKVGSGDQFVAHFAYGWMIERISAAESAARASKATAYYCERAVFPSLADLAAFDPKALSHGPRWLSGYKAKVYLAGPFFTLAQMWMVEQARRHLSDMGLDVFSPYHDIGRGDAARVVPLDLKAIRECDLVFAIADGLDSGTVYEIGYARSEGRPVVVYSENETAENLKMMEGSDCFMCSDFVNAIYRAAWIAVSL